ncbi:MAG: prepilin-type N-terminal cleavage/methylation domain-containing protein [Planctomycetaceae bacterium]|nr:prepilin-type N-terminal cleavage/methylation domain-containing protein [Planctomycetaceae bacterium]
MAQNTRLWKRNAGFTLIELLVVIAIIALLLSIVTPALRRAKESAKSLVCCNNLKTLALANQLYASRQDNWFVPAVDSTMTAKGQPTWNSNAEYRDLVGLEQAYTGSAYQMPKQYLCPTDKQANPEYWASVGGSYQNYVSYGYNFTDWGPGSKNQVSWSGNIPSSTWACRLRVNEITAPGSRIMFVDGGDLWARMDGANYRLYWDKYGQDIVAYRKVNMWYPVYYRHGEGTNVAFFDGHADYAKKETMFTYEPPTSITGNRPANAALWFCSRANRAVSAP